MTDIIEYDHKRFYFYPNTVTAVKVRDYHCTVTAPDVDAAKKAIEEFYQKALAYKMQPLRQTLCVKHSDYDFEQIEEISLSTGHGFDYDDVRDLYVEDDIAVGDRVFVVQVRWTDWGGTFGEDTTRVSAAAITKDHDVAVAIEKHLNEYGDVEHRETGYIPWQGYGCGIQSVSIISVPVTN